MFTDALLYLSSSQPVTASAVSTNTIDMGASLNVGMGGLAVAVTVDEAVTASGAATVQIQVITSASADLSSPTVLVETPALAKTTLTAGRRPINIRIPQPQLTNFLQRYLGLNYVVATGPLTAGKFTASIVESTQQVDKLHATGVYVG